MTTLSMAVRIAAAALALCFFGAPLRSGETALVEYTIDGTAKWADVTWNTGGGSMEQKRLKFPVHESFRLPPGGFAYVAAQKTRVTRVDPTSVSNQLEVLSDGVTGTVHVTVRVNFKLAGEATSDAPFGIAKVSAEVK